MFTLLALNTGLDIALHSSHAKVAEYFLVPSEALYWANLDAQSAALTLIRKLRPNLGFIFICFGCRFAHDFAL